MPRSKRSNYIDKVIASKAVIAAIRIAIISVAIYIVFSVAWLIANLRFLVPMRFVRVASMDAENQRLKEPEALHARNF